MAAALVAAVSVEMATRLLARRGSVVLEQYRTTSAPAFWSDIDTGFGVWHPANTTFHHAGACWDVTYHTNSYGARDVEQAKRSSERRRHVVLGDSFIEGWSIADGERLTDRLTASTGEDFLNFGTGGAFGTVQELVLYRTLAASFDHADVLLFVTPVNDFVDNDPRYYDPRRYRPYLRKTAGGYEVYYTVGFDDRDRGNLGRAGLAWNWISNHVDVINLLRQSLQPYRSFDAWTSYDGHSDGQIEMMAEGLRELGAAAAPRAVRVFLIPIEVDLAGYAGRGQRYSLADRLRARAGSAGNVEVHDLLPDFSEYAAAHHVPLSSFFQPCDFHWSPLGNAVAAEVVTRQLGN